jgi:hypothetical protein
MVPALGEAHRPGASAQPARQATADGRERRRYAPSAGPPSLRNRGPLLTLPAREHASNTVGAGRDSPPPAAIARPAEPGTSAIPATQPPLHQVQHCCGTRQWRCSSGKIPGRRQPAPPWTPSPPGTIHSGPPNPTLHLMQLGLELEPGHQPTAAPSPPAPPRREARDELKISLTSKTATSPHGCPGPSTSETKARAAPRPLRPPGKRHGLPDRCPRHQCTRLPGRPRPGQSRGPPGGHTGMDARLGDKRQGQGTRGTGTGTPVKRLPTPLPGPDSRPLCVRGHRNTTPYSATR